MTLLGDDRELSALMANHARTTRLETIDEASAILTKYHGGHVDDQVPFGGDPFTNGYIAGLKRAITVLEDMK